MKVCLLTEIAKIRLGPVELNSRGFRTERTIYRG